MLKSQAVAQYLPFLRRYARALTGSQMSGDAYVSATLEALIGDPGAIGITDLGRPDYGEPVSVYANEVPVFWGCGVTPQAQNTGTSPS